MLNISDNRLGIGGNRPPSAIELVGSGDTAAALSAFLKDHPVILTEEEAREAKLLKDRADAAVKDLEDERDALVRPLNEQVRTTNDRYRQVREPLAKIIGEIKTRLTAFARAEEQRRHAAAEAARRAAEEAARQAREAEERERQAAEEAAAGVFDVDVGGAIEDADAAFNAFRKAGRAAERAERATHVRIAGGHNKAISLRTHEVLTVTDAHAAIEEMGLTDNIRDAILTAARTYRKAFGELPEGIAATLERTI